MLIGGTSAADHATVTQAGDQITVTQEGYDSRQFAISDVTVLHFVGLDGDDFFSNESSIPSRAYGHGGNDHFIGGEGDDRLIGNDGDDLLEANGGNDFIFAGTGDDTILGGQGDDRILGADGFNRIEGEDGADTIFGGRGNDLIFGGNGDDFLSGWLGEDQLYGNDGADVIHAGEGDDEAFGGQGDDRLYGHNGNDQLVGGDGSDVVSGNKGDDVLTGNSGADRIVGGPGVDQSIFEEYSEEHRAVIRGNAIEVTDLSGDGIGEPDIALTVEQFSFRDGDYAPADLVRASLPAAREVVFVQAIVVADNNGSNQATFFGSSDQEVDIKERIDEIFAQAEVDVEFLPTKNWDDSFSNFGSLNRNAVRLAGDRPESHLERVIDKGDSVLVGSSDQNVIDMYFVERVPGFGFETEYTVNGLAFVDYSGIAVHVGDNLVRSASGREIVAEVVAHEIGHNLGLDHVEDDENLLSTDGRSDHLTSDQIETIIASRFTQPI